MLNEKKRESLNKLCGLSVASLFQYYLIFFPQKQMIYFDIFLLDDTELTIINK
jgi:predicted DNA-binding protein YlxM (UPF0122 family)